MRRATRKWQKETQCSERASIYLLLSTSRTVDLRYIFNLCPWARRSHRQHAMQSMFEWKRREMSPAAQLAAIEKRRRYMCAQLTYTCARSFDVFNIVRYEFSPTETMYVNKSTNSPDDAIKSCVCVGFLFYFGFGVDERSSVCLYSAFERSDSMGFVHFSNIMFFSLLWLSLWGYLHRKTLTARAQYYARL